MSDEYPSAHEEIRHAAGDGDEVLDSRPGARPGRWGTLVLLAVGALVLAVVIGRASGLVRHDARPSPATGSTATQATQVTPVIPEFPAPRRTTSQPVDRLSVFHLCPTLLLCRHTRTSAADLRAVRSALHAAVGPFSRLHVSSWSAPSPDQDGDLVLFSRVIRVTLPAGRLKILVTSALNSMDPSLTVPGRQILISSDVVGGYTLQTALSLRSGNAIGSFPARVHRLTTDRRLSSRS